MSWLIFFLVIFALAALTAGGVMARHFSEVAALDIESLPQAQEKQIKHYLMENKLARRWRENWQKIGARLRPVARGWRWTQRTFRRLANFVGDRARELEWEKRWHEWRQKSKHERRAESLQLLTVADELRRAEKYAEAEKKYVALISLEPRNVNAYLGLGKSYFRRGNWVEAETAFRYVVENLEPENELAWAFLGRVLKGAGQWEEAVKVFERALGLSDVLAKRWVDLSECYEKLGGMGEALTACQRAVEREPNNPRTLDRLLEISVISGQKRLAWETLQQLRAANPENQKLEEWEEKIAEI